MAQLLKVLIPLAKDLGSLPSTHVGQFITPCNCSPGDLRPSTGLIRHLHVHLCANNYKPSQTNNKTYQTLIIKSNKRHTGVERDMDQKLHDGC